MISRGALIAITAVVIALGMVFGAALWIIAGIVAIGTVAACYTMANAMDGSVVVDRGGGDIEVKSGSKVPVTIEIINASRWPLAWVSVEDVAPAFATVNDGVMVPPIQIDGQRLGVMLLPPGGTHQLQYSVDCRRRGYLQLGPTLVETGDLLGLFRRLKIAGRPTYITVLPTVYPVASYEIGSRRPIGEIRLRERSMEDPTRIRGIRHWQLGDPMRSVHWAATARTGILHSKIYEPSSIIGATIILDMHTASNPVSQEPVRGDLAISAAASIANHLLNAGEPFGLVTNGRDAADRLRHTDDHAVDRRSEAKKNSMAKTSDRRRPTVMKPEKSAVHYQSMLRTLARLERSDALTLPELLVECESRISADTTLLIILQMADEASLAAMISMYRRGRAVEVILNTHDKETFARLAGPLTACNIHVHHLLDSDSIIGLCQRMAIR